MSSPQAPLHSRHPLHGTFLIASTVLPPSKVLQDPSLSDLPSDILELLADDELRETSSKNASCGLSDGEIQFCVHVRYIDILTGKLSHHMDLFLPPKTTPEFLPGTGESDDMEDNPTTPTKPMRGGTLTSQSSPQLASIVTVPHSGRLFVSAFDASLSPIQAMSQLYSLEPRRRIYMFDKRNGSILRGVILCATGVGRLWGLGGSLIWTGKASGASGSGGVSSGIGKFFSVGIEDAVPGLRSPMKRVTRLYFQEAAAEGRRIVRGIPQRRKRVVVVGGEVVRVSRNAKFPFAVMPDERHFVTLARRGEMVIFDNDNGVVRGSIPRGHQDSKQRSQAVVDLLPVVHMRGDREGDSTTSCWRGKNLGFVSVGAERYIIRVWAQDPKVRRRWRRFGKIEIEKKHRAGGTLDGIQKLPSHGAVWLEGGRIALVQVFRRIGGSSKSKPEARMEIWELDGGGKLVQMFPLGHRSIPSDVFAFGTTIGIRWGLSVKLFALCGDCVNSYELPLPWDTVPSTSVRIRLCKEESLIDIPELDDFVAEESGVNQTLQEQVASKEERLAFVMSSLESEDDEEESTGELSFVELAFGNVDVRVPKSLLALSQLSDEELMSSLSHPDLNIDADSLLSLLWGNEPSRTEFSAPLDVYMLFKRLKLLSHALAVCYYPLFLGLPHYPEESLIALAEDTFARLDDHPPRASCAFSEAVIRSANVKIRDVAVRERLQLDSYEVLPNCRLGDLPEFEELQVPQGETFAELFSSTISVAFENERFTNVVLESEDGLVVCAHREILTCLDPWFYRIFRFPGVESRGSHVMIEDLSGDSLSLFVEFVYKGRFPDLNPDRTTNMYSLLLLAFLCEKYCDQRMKVMVLNQIRSISRELLAVEDGSFELEVFRCGFLYALAPSSLGTELRDVWLPLWQKTTTDQFEEVTLARLHSIVKLSQNSEDAQDAEEMSPDQQEETKRRLLLVSSRQAALANRVVRAARSGMQRTKDASVAQQDGEEATLEDLRADRVTKIRGGLLRRLFPDQEVGATPQIGPNSRLFRTEEYADEVDERRRCLIQ